MATELSSQWGTTHGWGQDDVIKWKHFSRYWPFVQGIHGSPVNLPSQGPVRQNMFSLICVWTKGWVNIRDAGDLRRHRAHYDVVVIGHSHKWSAFRFSVIRCAVDSPAWAVWNPVLFQRSPTVSYIALTTGKGLLQCHTRTLWKIRNYHLGDVNVINGTIRTLDRLKGFNRVVGWLLKRSKIPADTCHFYAYFFFTFPA